MKSGLSASCWRTAAPTGRRAAGKLRIVCDNARKKACIALRLVIYCRARTLFHSLVASLSLLSALITAVAVLGKNRAAASIARAYETVDEFGALLAPESPSDLGSHRLG